MPIHCLKINQSALKFPFDRIYLLPNDQKNLVKRLFRYSLSTPLTGQIREDLRTLNINKTHVIERLRGSLTGKNTNTSLDIMIDDRWLIVVPTYLIPVTKDPEHKGAYRLAYMFAQNVTQSNTFNTERPRVQLQTPIKTVPFICAICAALPAYYVNECSFGTTECHHCMRLHNSHLF